MPASVCGCGNPRNFPIGLIGCKVPLIYPYEYIGARPEMVAHIGRYSFGGGDAQG
jgi:hypothetical protein